MHSYITFQYINTLTSTLYSTHFRNTWLFDAHIRDRYLRLDLKPFEIIIYAPNYSKHFIPFLMGCRISQRPLPGFNSTVVTNQARREYFWRLRIFTLSSLIALNTKPFIPLKRRHWFRKYTFCYLAPGHALNRSWIQMTISLSSRKMDYTEGPVT